MLKKTIVYKDFNEDEVREDFYFHLTAAELIENRALFESVRKAMESGDNLSTEDEDVILREFKSMILLSYGKRSADGKRHDKSQALRDEFVSTTAYSALFIELLSNTEAALEFLAGIVPKDVEAAIVKVTEEETRLVAVPKPDPIVLTKADILEMSSDEVAQLGDRITSGEVVLGDVPE